MPEKGSPPGTSLRVVADPDATPFERVIARRIRCAAVDDRSDILARLDVVVTVTSNRDPQRATVTFASPQITIDRDRPAESTLDVTTNGISLTEFEATGSNGRAEAVISCLRPPDLSWRSAAEAFWRTAGGRSGLPSSLLVVCSDDGSELRLGSEPDVEYEIHGDAAALVELLDGRTPFLELLVTRRLFFRGTIRQLSVLQGVILDVMLDA